MKFDLIYYAFPRSNQLDHHLHSLRNELSRNIPEFSALKIIDGEREHGVTFCFLDSLVNSMGSTIDVDAFTRILFAVRADQVEALYDRYPHVREFFELNASVNREDLSRSLLTARTFICREEKGLRFKDDPSYHGLTAPRFFAVAIKSYKNIIWHEAGHLFGADDHYCRERVYEMSPECTDRESCVMQFNPGSKSCCFCTKAIDEIKKDMDGPPRRPMFID